MGLIILWITCIVILMFLLGGGQIMLYQVDKGGASSSPLLNKFIFYTSFSKFHNILTLYFIDKF